MEGEIENALYVIGIIKETACQYGALCTLEKRPLGGSVVRFLSEPHLRKQ